MYDLFLPHIFHSFPASNILIVYTEDIARNSTAELLKVGEERERERAAILQMCT